MTDDVEPPVGPPAPGDAPSRRWMRWGKVYVDIEPPQGPNPWLSSTSAVPVLDPPVAAPAPAGGRRWRPLVLFVVAVLVGALVTTLLMAALRRDDRGDARRPVAGATTTRPPAARTTPTSPVTRPATVTTVPTAPTRPTTGGSTTTAPASGTTTPTTVPGGAGTTTAPRPGNGPITVPEGIEPAPSAPSSAPSSSAAPTTAPARPARPAPTTTVPAAQAFLGVEVEDAVDGPQVVSTIAGSGAEKAGILAGDLILSVDTTTVATVDDLAAAVAARRPGDTVTVRILRNGANVSVTATLGTRA